MLLLVKLALKKEFFSREINIILFSEENIQIWHSNSIFKIQTDVNVNKHVNRNNLILKLFFTAMRKSVRVRSFSGSYSVSLRIQSECGKMRTKKLRIWIFFMQCNRLQKFCV